MSRWAILLRVSLSVALILNGATTAMASVHMAYGSAPPTAAPMKKTTAATTVPCHEQQQAPSAELEEAVAVPVTPAHANDSLTPDCCDSDSSACHSVCMYSSPAAVPMMAFAWVWIEHAISPQPLSLGRAAPALPHLIRPPIG